MIVTISPTEKIIVGWCHRVPETKQEKKKYRRLTTCFIKDVQQEKLFGEGKALCSISDNFDKSKARKLSLQRALAEKHFDKEKRTIIWTTYNERACHLKNI
jgi:hypothetical protein